LEGQDLPLPGSVRQFLQAVDAVRDDTARLEARVARLRQHFSATADKP